MKISLIIPCYNEEEALPTFYAELEKVTAQMPAYTFEMLFIDDGSKDNTLQIVKGFSDKDERVQYISFSRRKRVKKTADFRCFRHDVNQIAVVEMRFG